MTIGFTAGIALIIASQQIDTALGLKTGPLPAQVFERLAAYWQYIDTINPYAIAITAGDARHFDSVAKDQHQAAGAVRCVDRDDRRRSAASSACHDDRRPVRRAFTPGFRRRRSHT